MLTEALTDFTSVSGLDFAGLLPLSLNMVCCCYCKVEGLAKQGTIYSISLSNVLVPIDGLISSPWVPSKCRF
jgi:hypothetical protein